MHDFQQATAGATADLLNDLKAGGYKIVHMRAALADHHDRGLRRGGPQGRQAADGQFEADFERGPHRQRLAEAPAVYS